MRRLSLLLTVFLAGCAGMDSATRQQFETARDLSKSDPQQALAELSRIVEQFPENVEIRRARAETFERLGRDNEAFEEWNFIVRVRASKSSDDLSAAHYGVIAAGERLLGDLPHRIAEPPQGAERDQIVAIQNSYDALLEEHPDHRRDEQDRHGERCVSPPRGIARQVHAA